MSYRFNHNRYVPRMVFFFALALLFFPSHAQEKENVAYPGFQLLEEPTSPRNIAMGSAATAGAGSGFAYYNPAMPFFTLSKYLAIEYGHSPGDLRRAHFEAAFPFRSWFFAASIHTETISDIFGTSFDGSLPKYNTPFSSQLSSMSLGAGYIKNNQLSFALSLSGIQERIETEYAYAASVSAGLAYKLIPDKLHLGLSAFHLGTSTGFLDTISDWGKGSDLPKSGRFGASWQDTIKMIPYTIQGDIVYRNADKRIMVPIGLELRPINPLAIRVGKRLNHDTEVMNLGCALQIDPLSVDLSFVIPKLRTDTELKWLVGVTYSLRKGSERKSQHHSQKQSDGSETQPSAERTEDRHGISEGSPDTSSKTKENKDLPDSADNGSIDTTVDESMIESTDMHRSIPDSLGNNPDEGKGGTENIESEEVMVKKSDPEERETRDVASSTTKNSSEKAETESISGDESNSSIDELDDDNHQDAGDNNRSEDQ
ncbi:MAG: hypothetical protein ACOC4C_03755 [Fibrobacterota bacterium]